MELSQLKKIQDKLLFHARRMNLMKLRSDLAHINLSQVTYEHQYAIDEEKFAGQAVDQEDLYVKMAEDALQRAKDALQGAKDRRKRAEATRNSAELKKLEYETIIVTAKSEVEVAENEKSKIREDQAKLKRQIQDYDKEIFSNSDGGESEPFVDESGRKY